MRRAPILLVACLGILLNTAISQAAYEKKPTWAETMKSLEKSEQAAKATMLAVAADFPVEFDWLEQDAGAEFKLLFTGDAPELREQMLSKVYEDIKRSESADLPADKWFDAYAKACQERRQKRLSSLEGKVKQLVFTKHYNMGGSHYAYTEGLSDAQHERHFVPGSALCLYDLETGKTENLLEDKAGVIRDPDVSFDGKRVLFAWKKSLNDDDYHLYEMNLDDRKIRQLTFGIGFADYEGIYLPNDDIIFNSTRCVQTVDCWHTEVSNLYKCDKDGKQMRRLCFDQVHSNYPQLLDDGRVTYTRWEYNDRGQLFPQPLFQMNQDGTSQTEYYGNNSIYPTTIAHARGVPGSHKVMAIASGHHTRQLGRLILIDNQKGRRDARGITYLAPVEPAEPVRVDAFTGPFQYPYPLSESEFFVSYAAAEFNNLLGNKYKGTESKNGFGIYYMTADGTRELLARDAEVSCNQPVVVGPRQLKHMRPTTVDYTQDEGTFYVQDVYIGPGLEGVERGTIKKLRAVTMTFREATIGANGNRGPAGGALVSTPVSMGGSWDPKIILGDATVYEDGSCCFNVPARIPVYFQALDENNRVVQTMRSWSTLMPGERFACLGCHENKNEALQGRYASNTIAMRKGPETLKPFYGEPRGFSFRTEIQPILDKHCVECHREGGKKADYVLTGEVVKEDRSKREWTRSYRTLTKDGKINDLVNWVSPQSVPAMMAPYEAGSNKSKLLALHDKGHNDVKLSQEEKDKLAAWIDLGVPFAGDYVEANTWNEAEKAKFVRFANKRKYAAALEREGVEEYVKAATGQDFKMPAAEENPYRNLAVNPNDAPGEAKSYPHASSNSEYKGLEPFLAKNAIDGKTANTGHGPKFPSWGPDKAEDLWWMVEFGKDVDIDRVDIFIRADFPHDGHWTEATLEFSDGSTEQIKLQKTAGRQSFPIKRRTTKSVKIKDLKQEGPLGWCGLSEVEVWGQDVEK